MPAFKSRIIFLLTPPAVIRSAPPSRSVWSTQLRFFILFLPILSALDHRVAKDASKQSFPSLTALATTLDSAPDSGPSSD
jgi:hypothetical protein